MATSAPRPTGRVVAAVRRVDDWALGWVSRTDHGAARPLLTGTARATDVLAPVVAASLWIGARDVPDRERQAMHRAWVAMGLAALAESVVARATRRGRPDVRRLPRGQRRSASPSSSAFPSGHVGAMAAFSVVTGRQAPGLRPWLATGTAVAAYARLFTGRHYLSDVVAGSVIGAAVGALFQGQDAATRTTRIRLS